VLPLMFKHLQQMELGQNQVARNQLKLWLLVVVEAEVVEFLQVLQTEEVAVVVECLRK
jgi:hypothetical protein